MKSPFSHTTWPQICQELGSKVCLLDEWLRDAVTGPESGTMTLAGRLEPEKPYYDSCPEASKIIHLEDGIGTSSARLRRSAGRER